MSTANLYEQWTHCIASIARRTDRAQIDTILAPAGLSSCALLIDPVDPLGGHCCAHCACDTV